MARGKLISDFERDCIKIGHHVGLTKADMARALGRTKPFIAKYLDQMKEDGTLGDLPLCSVIEDIGAMMRAKGCLK